MRATQRLISRRARGYRAIVLEREQFLVWVSQEDSYARFQADWLAEQHNGLLKDAAFLSWRTGAPGATYRFVCLYKDTELVGLALVRPTVLRGVKTLAVLDLMVRSEHLSGANAMHRAVLEVGIEERTDLVACMMSRPWAARYRLASSLYLRSPFVFALIANHIGTGSADDQVYDQSRWNLGWIDSDDL